MYPILFEVPGTSFDVSSFGVMMMFGFLAAYWITVRELPHKGIDPSLGPNLLILVMFSGILGSKIYYATDMMVREGQPWSSYFFQNNGITWYGGLLGGIFGGFLACRLYDLKMRRLLECAAVSTAVGQSIGRLGCFLVGDDYGVESNVPWAIAFPLGSPPVHVPVHPTQLYEFVWLLFVAYALYSRRDKSPFLFGEYLVANGLGRLLIEMLRLNPKAALGLTEPQWIGIGLTAIGILSWLYYRNVDRHLDIDGT